jgi:7-cyano-7-deazaguanine synthase in queuosine biosynthesis
MTVLYRQRPTHAEIMAAGQLAHHLGVPHRLLDLTSYGSLLPGSALLDGNAEHQLPLAAEDQRQRWYRFVTPCC